LMLVIAVGAAGAVVYFDVWRMLASYAAPLLTERRTDPVSSGPPSSPASSAPAEGTAADGPAPGRESTAPATAAVPPNANPSTAADDRLTVRLSVSRPCWVSAMVDGRKAIERLLQT